MTTQDTQNLGGRLPLLLPDTLSPEQRSLYSTLLPAKQQEGAKGGFITIATNGALVGPFNSYLFIPEIAKGYNAWIDAQHAYLPLDPATREVIILTVGAAWKSAFGLYAHRAVAGTIGISPDVIEALAHGEDHPKLSSVQRTAQRFTQALVVDHRVEEDLYFEARDIFGDAGLVALVHLIGLYLSVSAVLNAFEVPVPQHVK